MSFEAGIEVFETAGVPRCVHIAMRFRIAAAALIFASSVAHAATVASLFDSVRNAIRTARSDADIASLITQTRLTERLQDAVIEQLETEGAGQETMGALRTQQASTEKLPAPAQPVTLFEIPATPSANEQTETIDQARTHAVQYTAGLPNFLCTQVVSRYSGKPASWKLDDILGMSVGYTAKGEQYKLETIGGQPAKKTLTQVGGFHSNGEFGSLLKSIFRPEAQTTFHWERWTNLRGRRAHVFSLRVQQNRSNYKLRWATMFRKYEMFAGVTGFVYVDRETHEILRVMTIAEGIPADWPIRGVSTVLDYGAREIGGRRFLLPGSAESTVFLRSGEKRNVTEFSNYRKFSGESNISFEPSEPA